MRHANELKPYAVNPLSKKGRFIDEDDSPHRSAHQRDRDRILHSTAFRRLMHKTQVFVAHEGDYYRTRLTHSLEVAQIARSSARTLHLNEDLAEAVALAHDLGHTPFGHAGEDALHEAMKAYGGFDHNAQALRIVTYLEQRYARFDGLNLTWETLEGLVKHNGPLIGALSKETSLPAAIAEYDAQHSLNLHTHSSLEGQLAALADDIAYNNHDIDDGVRAGFFTIEEVGTLPLLDELLHEVDTSYPDLNPTRRKHEVLRRLFAVMVSDMLNETRRRIDASDITTEEDVRNYHEPLVGFSEKVSSALPEIRAFLMTRMYRHYRVNRMMGKAKRVITDCFSLMMDTPNLLPEKWAQRAEGVTETERARIVADYIAGMTDRFALDEHRRLTDPYSKA